MFDILALELLPDAEHAVDALVAALGARGAAPEVVIVLVTPVSVTSAPARPVSPLRPPQLLHIHRVNLTTETFIMINTMTMGYPHH